MRKLAVLLLVVSLGMAAAVPAVAHPPNATDHGAVYVGGKKVERVIQPQTKAVASHDFIWCSQWAANDGAHPDAPGSYSRYHCHDPEGLWANVHGLGKYSGTWHNVLIHHWHNSQGWWVWDSMSHGHGHPF